MPRGDYATIPDTQSFVLHRDGSYSYSYGPKGARGLLNNTYALSCAVFASIGGLSFGYDQGVIANVLVMPQFLALWPLTAFQEGSMTAVLELGALVGALLAGVYADQYSRRQSMFAACVVFCIGSIFQGAATTLEHIFIGRTIGGIGVGALSMLCPLYLAEISPPEVRGSLMALEQFSIVLGVVLGFWTGFWSRNIPSTWSWRVSLYVQLVPGLILTVGCLFLPPSPRLLVMHHRYDEARDALSRLRVRPLTDPLLRLELLEMRVEEAVVRRVSESAESKGRLGGWAKLFEYKYRDRTAVGVLMMTFQQWSGINALLYYGPTLVHSIGLKGDVPALLVSGGIGIVQFVASIPAILFLDEWGRKSFLRGGTAMTAASHLLIAILIYLFSSDWEAHHGAAWIAVGAIYVFTFFYGISLGPIAWVLPGEVFPQSIRSKGVALSTASNWFNNFLIGLATPVLIEFSASATFMVFCIACFFAYLWSTYIVPETANVSLEEIDKMFRSSAGQEERLLRSQIEEDLGLRDLLRELASETDPWPHCVAFVF